MCQCTNWFRDSNIRPLNAPFTSIPRFLPTISVSKTFCIAGNNLWVKSSMAVASNVLTHIILWHNRHGKASACKADAHDAGPSPNSNPPATCYMSLSVMPDALTQPSL